MRAGPLLAAFAIVIPDAPAPAQGYGRPYDAPPSYGAPYSPPWQAGARGDRRPLDGSYRRPPPPRPAEPDWRPSPPAAIWQGLYIGGHGGATLGRLTDRDFDEAVRLEGGVAGVHAGYNAQFGSWVIGLEADGTWSNADGRRAFDGPVTVGAHSDWQSSLRLRAGYAFHNLLIYGTAGAAFAGIDASVTDALDMFRAGDAFFGYAAGVGIEMKLAPHVSGRIEALHYGFGDKSLNFATGSVPVDLDATTVRAGLTFHFH